MLLQRQTGSVQLRDVLKSWAINQLDLKWVLILLELVLPLGLGFFLSVLSDNQLHSCSPIEVRTCLSYLSLYNGLLKSDTPPHQHRVLFIWNLLEWIDLVSAPLFIFVGVFPGAPHSPPVCMGAPHLPPPPKPQVTGDILGACVSCKSGEPWEGCTNRAWPDLEGFTALDFTVPGFLGDNPAVNLLPLLYFSLILTDFLTLHYSAMLLQSGIKGQSVFEPSGLLCISFFR